MSEKVFREEELEITGEYPTVGTYYGYPQDMSFKRRFPVSPRENMRLFMDRKDSWWIPELGARDVAFIYPDIVPDCVACGFEGGLDSFGVEWIPVTSNEELPAFVKPGNPKLKDILDWRKLDFPAIETWDWAGSSKMYDTLGTDKYRVGIMLSSFFERLISLMDFEGAAMALIEEPEETAAFMEKLGEYNTSLIEHYKKYYDIDAVVVHDDWGSQRAPFFSRATLQEVILPSYKKMVDRAHALGVKVITHCCGNSEAFVPDMLDVGSDAWELQEDANPNKDQLIEQYGDRLFFEVYGIIPSDESLERYREIAGEFMKKYGSTKNVLISLKDETFMPDMQKDTINYELARKVVSKEL